MRDFSRRMILSWLQAPLLAPFVGAVTGSAAWAQTAATPADTEWRSYAGSLASTRYSPLEQINAGNFSKLEIAWRFKPDLLGPRPEYVYETTPLLIKGILYTTAGSRRDVVAMDASNGEMLWMHSENEGERAKNAPRQYSGHGVSYWTDGKDERILYVTPGYRLIALDARTGVPVKSFGENGMVDLKTNDDQEIDLVTGEVGLHSTPLVIKDVVVVGAAHLTGGAPPHRRNVKGYVRGFDVRTGKRKWIFHTIPRKGEFGYDTWIKPGQAEEAGNTGAWAQMSADAELGLVYVPVELPTGDYNGQYRHGAGLFGETLVAVDAQTGKRRWHYQFVHHGLWDMDIPCAPILCDIPVNGKIVKALAQPSKQCYLYVLNRETGEPVWPINEMPVPAGNVPEEWYSPTQPIPSKPPAYEMQGVTHDDLIDFTPALRAEAIKMVDSQYTIGPLFTPPSMAVAGGNRGTLHTPGQATRITQAMGGDSPAPARPVAAPAGGGEGGGRGGTVQGLPLLKPPYGSISAINLEKGDITWRIAHGETPDNITNHPALKGLKIPRTGRSGMVGPLCTKTLVICGETGFGPTPSGQRGAMLRAYDKATGEEKGAVYTPAGTTGSPMTYMLKGQQYLVVACGGGNVTAELLAFKLPRG